MDNKEKKKNKPFLLYVVLGLLIFFGVQQYNQTINAPTDVTFSDFQELINSGKVDEAIIKEQSNTVEFKTGVDDETYRTEYPEGFEGEIFQLLVDQNIVLTTDTEPAGFQEYFIAFLPWIFTVSYTHLTLPTICSV